MADFKAEDKKLEDVLFTGAVEFRVPPFQRPYAWESDQIEEFWQDLNSKKGSSFLGSFVLNNEYVEEEGFIEIIDGQQRIVTSVIFLAALRDTARTVLKDVALGERIQNDISVTDRKGVKKYRLTCGESLDAFFKKTIQNPETAGTFSDDLSDEEVLVRDTYRYFRQMIEAEVVKRTDKTEQTGILTELWEKLINLKVIRILLGSEEDAYVVFETVNARGADLTVADLLKNHIFKHLRSEERGLEKAQEKWNTLVANVAQTDVELPRFLRQYWLSKFGYLSEKALYKEMKAKVSDFSAFLDDILDASAWYNRLLVGEKSDWKEVGGVNGLAIYQSLRGIRAMGVNQCFVLFLALMQNKDRIGTDTSYYFQLVEHFTFQYSTIGKQQANRVEKLYSRVAVELAQAFETGGKHADKNIQRSLSLLKEEFLLILPSPILFLENFSSLSLKQSEKSRVLTKYMLSKIDGYENKREFDLDFDTISLEHILPRSPEENWNLTKKDIKGYINLLGNLTLVHRDYNSAAGNKSLEDKMAYLGKTKIDMTLKLVETLKASGVWTEKEIQARQTELAEKASHVWSIA